MAEGTPLRLPAHGLPPATLAGYTSGMPTYLVNDQTRGMALLPVCSEFRAT